MDEQKYIDQLKQDLIIALNTELGYTTTNKEFKQGNFTSFRKAIAKKLDLLLEDDNQLQEIKDEIRRIGNAVSESVLKNIIRYKYKVPVPIPDAQHKSLTKLGIYLGYKNWTDYKLNREKTLVPTEEQLKRINIAIKKAIIVFNKFTFNVPAADERKLRLYFTDYMTNRIVKRRNSEVLAHESLILFDQKKIKFVELFYQSANVYLTETRIEKHPPSSNNLYGNDPNLTCFEISRDCLYKLQLTKNGWKISDRAIVQESLLYFPKVETDFDSESAWPWNKGDMVVRRSLKFYTELFEGIIANA